MTKSKFKIGDLVKIDGYLGVLFRVEAVGWVHTYQYGFCYQGFLYKVRDIETNEIMDAFESEMNLVKKADVTNTVTDYDINNSIMDYDGNKVNIKILWQEYEDYLTLYEMFKDDTYKQRADEIFNLLNNNKNNK
jgi:hypothetical protein